jgi:ribosomal protein S12 methylthiotransferase
MSCRDAHPQVLAVTGPHATDEVMQRCTRICRKPHDPFTEPGAAAGHPLTPQHYAYLKISEGCNHRCTFCIIPSMRGDLVSRPIGEVLQEAKHLAEAGVQGVAGDLAGHQRLRRRRQVPHRLLGWAPGQDALKELCEALAELGIWVRLHYVYPYPSVDDLIPLMAEGKILPYLDVPFQHASPRILKAMKRPASAENVLERIRAWRAICPEITIRSPSSPAFPAKPRPSSRNC